MDYNDILLLSSQAPTVYMSSDRHSYLARDGVSVARVDHPGVFFLVFFCFFQGTRRLGFSRNVGHSVLSAMKPRSIARKNRSLEVPSYDPC